LILQLSSQDNNHFAEFGRRLEEQHAAEQIRSQFRSSPLTSALVASCRPAVAFAIALRFLGRLALIAHSVVK
jgi:hypothetical protein